jgi:cell division protease FtsH
MDEVLTTLIPVSRDRAEAEIVAAAPVVRLSMPVAAADHLAAWTHDQKTVAVHEAGHAVIAAVLEIGLNAVSIRHHRGGHTETSLEEDDRPKFRADSVLRAEITMCFAGLAAERRILGEATDGGARDIDHASTLAKSRITAGLDSKFPPVSLDVFGYQTVPASILDLYGQRLIVELERGRADAERLVEQHAAAILTFAARLFAARRLEGAALSAALLDAGVKGSARRPA